MSDVTEAGKAEESTTNGPDWKDHAREWEKRAKENLTALEAVKAELEALHTTDAEWEQKLADAKARADEDKALAAKAVRDEYVNKLAVARFEAEATAKGVTLPGGFAEMVNLPAFIDAEGQVNADLVASFVASMTSQSPKFDQSFSSGPQGGSAPQVDYSPRAIAERVNQLSPY